MQRIGVLTSGGDSPGMNAAIRAVVRAAHYHGVAVTGIRYGYHGLMAGDLVDLGPRDVSGIINRGGTILGTARSKEFREAAGRAKAAETLKKAGVEGLVAIGGDGTYKGAQALIDEHGIRCIGMPGTIDNDIGGTDYTIGYDTALNTALEAIDRIRDTAASHDRLFFIEVMGRESGYLAMMAGIAGGAEEILVPETPTDIPGMIDRLHAGRARGKHSSIVVVAEGDEAGDALTIAKQVEAQSEFRDTRVTVIGHLQRGGTPSAFDRLLASRLGVRAVEALLEGEQGKMTGIYRNTVVLEPFEKAWTERTHFDPSFLKVAEELSV